MHQYWIMRLSKLWSKWTKTSWSLLSLHNPLYTSRRRAVQMWCCKVVCWSARKRDLSSTLMVVAVTRNRRKDNECCLVRYFNNYNNMIIIKSLVANVTILKSLGLIQWKYGPLGCYCCYCCCCWKLYICWDLNLISCTSWKVWYDLNLKS